MSKLIAQWSEWDAKFAALTRRERGIVAVAIIFGGALLMFNFGIDPLLVKARNARSAESAARNETTQQKSEVAVLSNTNADPDAGNRRRLEKLNQDLVAIGERLGNFEAGMVPPERMQSFLEGLLSRHRAIELLELKTLPTSVAAAQLTPRKNEGSPATAGHAANEPAKPDAPEGQPAMADGIYQHGIEIRLAGSYNDLLDYLAELERMPQQVMWHSVSLTVERYPRNVMVLRVYSVSLDRNWLVV